MPTTETPTQVNEPNEPKGAGPELTGPGVDPQTPEAKPPAAHSTSRWIDYDTHELLDMISELEDERRWARLREGVLWAILLHALLILAIALLPKYIYQPRVIVPNISKHDEWTYLDSPPIPAHPQPKVEIKPVPESARQIDKKTLEAMQKTPPPPQQPVKQPEVQNPVQQPPPPAQTNPQTQSQVEAPHPPAVPARPNFAMGSQNPEDQMRQAMRGAASSPGYGAPMPSGSGLSRHPGAGTGGVEVLSDTQGVDFSSWLNRWHHETERTWDPLIPDEVNPPILKTGAVQIRFKVLPNGRIMEGSMILEGRSGDTGLDRAAWGALTGSNYPPLPHDFHGPYLELRALFLYNMQPPSR